MSFILNVENISKRFGGLKAVSNLSFNVKEGEVLAIIGPNGAGKTTVFNLITGFYPVDEGKIVFNDIDITSKPPYVISRHGIARTFQNLRLFKNLTVLENVVAGFYSKNSYSLIDALFATPKRNKLAKSAEKVSFEILEFFKLAGKADNVAGALPYGEQRKLELARAIATNAKLVLIDEPAAGMNPTEVADFVDLLNSAREKFGLTFVLIEHQMELVMKISERIVVMDFGEKIMEGTPKEVKNDKRVIEAYLGEVC